MPLFCSRRPLGRHPALPVRRDQRPRHLPRAADARRHGRGHDRGCLGGEEQLGHGVGRKGLLPHQARRRRLGHMCRPRRALLPNSGQRQAVPDAAAARPAQVPDVPGCGRVGSKTPRLPCVNCELNVLSNCQYIVQRQTDSVIPRPRDPATPSKSAKEWFLLAHKTFDAASIKGRTLTRTRARARTSCARTSCMHNVIHTHIYSPAL